jgi:hypothetical protein
VSNSLKLPVNKVFTGLLLQTSVSESLSFFKRFGASRALFTWLQFRVFLATPDWQAQLPESCLQPDLTVKEYLQNWFEHRSESGLRPLIWLVINIAVLLLGVSSMIAALSYSGNEPVNLWLVLGLFAVLPMLLTLIAAIGIVLQRSYRFSTAGFSNLIVKVMRIPGEWLDFSRLLFSWTVWQSQSLAVLFNVGALAGFFLVALFRDISFGWSSTLIADTSTMIAIFKGFAAPWSLLVPLPAEETLYATRFYQNQTLDSLAQGSHWWPTVVMAVIVYGLLPRLILQQWLAFRFRTTLKKDIVQSGEVERFLNGCRRMTTHAAAVVASPDKISSRDAMATVSLCTDAYCFIGWQRSLDHKKIIYQLGLNSWQQDVDWIQSTLITSSEPFIIVAGVHQTPTGELADCIELIQSLGKTVFVGLIEVSPEQSQSGAFRSWQLFVNQHQVAMLMIRESDHD